MDIDTPSGGARSDAAGAEGQQTFHPASVFLSERSTASLQMRTGGGRRAQDEISPLDHFRSESTTGIPATRPSSTRVAGDRPRLALSQLPPFVAGFTAAATVTSLIIGGLVLMTSLRQQDPVRPSTPRASTVNTTPSASVSGTAGSAVASVAGIPARTDGALANAPSPPSKADEPAVDRAVATAATTARTDMPPGASTGTRASAIATPDPSDTRRPDGQLSGTPFPAAPLDDTPVGNATAAPLREAPPTASTGTAIDATTSPAIATATPAPQPPIATPPAAAVTNLDRAIATSVAAAPPVPPVVTPTAAIEQTLRRYQAAFSQLDAEAVHEVWPTVDRKALAKAFDQLHREDLTFDSCQVTVTGTTAVASCGGTAVYVPKIGNKNPRAERQQWRIGLHQVAEQWVVQRVDVAPR